MPFRIHLLIISAIIGIIYLAWQYMYATPVEAPVIVEQPVEEEASENKSIQIIHATWGMNCSNVQFGAVKEEHVANYANDTQNKKPVNDDNVLEAVGKLCNGKISCAIAINTDTLGPDPMPQCYDKQLEIEYRCFAFDRPWRVKSTNAPITIDCSKKGP